MAHKKLATDAILTLRGLDVTEVGFFWYSNAERYAQFLLIFDDRETMHDTFAQWLKEATGRLKQFESKGFITHRVQTTPQAFLEWCHARKLPLTAPSRSTFASQNHPSRTKVPKNLGDSIHDAFTTD